MRAGLNLGVLFLLLFAFPALADTRLALVIANGQYKAAPLSNPNVDAGLVSKALADVGFDVTVVENATLEQFDSALADFASKARGADLALFYYAGHGFAVSDRGVPRNYLMSVDADVTSTSERVLRAGGMPLDDIIHAVSEEARTTLVFIDACRNDPRVSRAAGGAGRSAVPIDNNIGESVFVGLSTRSGDVANDGTPGGGSPFARAFAAKIGTPGARLDDTFTQIRLEVENETKRDQRPDVGRYDLLAPLILKPIEAAPQAIASLAEPEATRQLSAGGDAVQSVAPPAQIAALKPDTPQAPAGNSRNECERLAGRSGPDEADLLFNDVDASRAVPACRAAVDAEPGDARLMYLLGKSLDKGQDFQAAAEWYQKAGDLGDARALSNLGTLYEAGDGVSRDYAKARTLYGRAGELGDATGYNNLGLLYENALGGSRDFVKAREAYERAAELGNNAAFNNLGLLYENGSGVTRDYAKAREYYERAADRGNAMAINNLGALYEEGSGVTKDYAKAREYYQRAGDLGNGLAIKNLGDLFENGSGVPKDRVRAREYYEKAADLGNGQALHQLAYFSDDGIAGGKDPEAAARYLELALRQGNEFSAKQMKTNAAAWSPAFRKALQARLKDAGVYDGKVDGSFGPATYSAIDQIFGTN